MADNLEGFSEEALKRAIEVRSLMEEIGRSTTSYNRQLTNASQTTAVVSSHYNSIKSAADQFAANQEKARESAKGAAKAFQLQRDLQRDIRGLNIKIDELYQSAAHSQGQAKDLLIEQAKNLANARDSARDLANSYEQLGESATKLNSSTRFFDKMKDVVKDIPLLGKLSGPFEKAAEAARKTALENAKTGGNVSTFGAGIKAMGSDFKAGISDFFKGFGWIGALVTVIKFIVDLFITANKQTVEIARNLSVTRESAGAVRDYFNDIQNTSKETYVNLTNLIKAQSELTNALERAGTVSESTLLAQTFLTERLKMSGDAAAVITARSEAFGENAEENLKTIMHQNKLDVQRGKSLMTQTQLTNALAKVNGQIAASFGFSNKAIAEGIKKVSQFGLTLQQAQKIAQGLLDFESSIGNELEAELLTGRELHMERARVLAVTGDIAGATAEVMKQMEGLTAEQRKSPIIMESFGKLLNMSTDEIQDAYQLEHDRTRQKEELVRLTREHKDLEAKQFMDKHGFNLQEYKDAQGIVTLEEQYQEALAKVKDQFAGLVNGGYVDILTDAIKAFANTLADLGFGDERRTQEVEQLARNAEEAIAGVGGWTEGAQAERLASLEEQAGLGSSTNILSSNFLGTLLRAATQLNSNGSRRTMEQQKQIDLEKRDLARQQLEDIRAGKSTINQKGQVAAIKPASQDKQRLKPADFTIQPLEEDTITMAGGTKLGGNVENKLDELIAAVKAGGNIYLNNQKVNENIGLSNYSWT